MTTRYGFVSTYPPTLCGLATFAAALRANTDRTDEADVVRLVDAAGTTSSHDVMADLVRGDAASIRRAAYLLNQRDVVVLQHEFGVFGGRDGDDALALLSLLEVPVVIVLHTVLSAPTPHQREVVEALGSGASALVTMSETARARLAAGYRVDMSRVSVIPHGAPPLAAGTSAIFRSAEPVLLTWGLLGPGKGIEWAIDAMDLLRDLSPMPRYVIAGQTHPKVVEREGQAYRLALSDRIRRLHLQDRVVLDGQYRHQAALGELVAGASVVLLPYDSTDQVTSGVLIEAVAAGIPVVATRFPHAVELLKDGERGLTVPHRDPVAIASAVRSLLAAPHLRGRPPQELLWPAVAARYDRLAMALMATPVPA